ncbi:hypothetical protein T12_15739, partial [Trichinella patagoniensis]
LLVRETKSTASFGPVSRRISTTSFRMKKLCDAVPSKLLELRSVWRSGVLCGTVEMQEITVSSSVSCHRTSPNGAAVRYLVIHAENKRRRASFQIPCLHLESAAFEQRKVALNTR